MNSNIKRWLGWLAIATVFAVACVYLSQWQFNRRAEAVAKIALVDGNYNQTPVELEELIASDNFSIKDEWRPIKLHGRYLPESAALVRNRPYAGAPGFLQLVPFQITTGKFNGSIVAIETGWLPTGDKQDSPDYTPLPDAADRDLVARVRQVEPTLNRDAPAGQIPTINVDALVEKNQLTAVGKVFRSFYARAESSYTSEKLPIVQLKPELTEGNHLSYALQWILFAVMAFAALWWAIKQEKHQRRLATDPTYQPKQRKRLGDDDKNFEDSISS